MYSLRRSTTLPAPCVPLFFVVDVFQSFFCDVLQCDLHKNMSNHTRLHLFSFLFLDGWTTNDLIYQWKSQGAVQFVANLSLPGGFKMDGHANVKCDVATATGNSLLIDDYYYVSLMMICFWHMKKR